MKLVILTFGHADTGSTKYRMRQFATQWQVAGFDLTWIEKKDLTSSHLDQIEAADLVINQKCLLPTSFAQKIRRVARRIIFDFDDALWTRSCRPYNFLTGWKVQRRLRFWLREANVVTTANQVLADYASQDAAKIHVLPMAIDTTEWKPAPDSAPATLRVGYAGSPASLPYLEAIGPQLCEMTGQLTVMSGKKPILPIPFVHVPYETSREIPFIQSLDVGLLPLQDDPFSRGKSPIKGLQYLSCSVPVVGNFIGASQEFLDNQVGCHVPHPSQWSPLLRHLLADPAMRRELGAAGRQRVMEHHDKTRLGQRWIELLQATTL